jgi:pimeloyl-ACP methyl ester carboxylesterase
VNAAAVSVGGRRLAYRRAGTGPPLLLLHGGWSDSREWWLQFHGLSHAYDVIAWDAPGCGGSSDPPDDFSLDDYADAVADLVGALDLAPVPVLGMSFGGGLAIAVAHRHPEIVRSLVLVSAYAGWAGSLPADVVAERVSRVLAEADRPPAEWAPGYLPGFFAHDVSTDVSDRVLAIMLDCRRAGIRPMMQAFAEADLRDALMTITAPALLLYGELDERAPLSVAQDIHRRLTGSELVVIPGVGHSVNLEAPEAFNREVLRFLDSSS